MGKKKRSVLAEIKRSKKKKEKKQVEFNNFIFDEGEFKNELPESFNKAEERRKFARFHDTVLKMIVPTVPKRQKAQIEGSLIKKVMSEIANKMQPHLHKYLLNYSGDEKRFLIFSFLFPDLIFLGEIICQPDRLIVKDIFETRQDEILTAYLNYQTFKEELSELKSMFSGFWNFMEANIFD